MQVLATWILKHCFLLTAKRVNYMLSHIPFLATCCRFPTSYEADVEQLDQHDSGASLLAPNHRTGILYRVGKKRIFRHYYLLATTALKLLTARVEDEHAFNRVWDEVRVPHLHEMILSYCTSTILPLFLNSLSSQADDITPPSNYRQGILVDSDD